jgi:hypothetical protein
MTVKPIPLSKTIEEKKEALERLLRESPAGQARPAFERGDSIFQTDFDLQNVKALVVPMFGASNTVKTNDPSAVLNAIVREGWKLVSAGFVFKELGHESRDKFLASGQQVATKGTVLGYYIFGREPEVKVETDFDRRIGELQKLQQRHAEEARILAEQRTREGALLAEEKARLAEEAAAGAPKLEPFVELRGQNPFKV